MTRNEAVLIFRADDELEVALPDELAAAANAFLVDGAHGLTLLASFPWFTNWGRDTFIALRGLLLATGRLAEAESILAAWARLVSAGMLPNRRSDTGDALNYNSVDAALWFVVAVEDFLREAAGTGYAVTEASWLGTGCCGNPRRMLGRDALRHRH